MALASAFVARWCAGSKVETAGGVFQVRDGEPAYRVAVELHRTVPATGQEYNGRVALRKWVKIPKPVQMRAGLLRTSLRLLTWACIALLAVLSLMPFDEIETVRTDLPGQVEHIIAYAGSSAVAMAGYGLSGGAVRIIGCFLLYAATLEYLQNFSPGRNPALVDFAASAFGTLCGGLVVLLVWRWRSRTGVGPPP